MSGGSDSNLCSATITQSAGVPSIAHSFSAIRWHTIGCRNVKDCAAPLRSQLGATICTSAKSFISSASARNPSARYPSSFVNNTRGFFTLFRTLPLPFYRDHPSPANGTTVPLCKFPFSNSIFRPPCASRWSPCSLSGRPLFHFGSRFASNRVASFPFRLLPVRALAAHRCFSKREEMPAHLAGQQPWSFRIGGPFVRYCRLYA